MQTRLLPALLLLLSVQVRPCPQKSGKGCSRHHALNPRNGWAPSSCPLPWRTESKPGCGRVGSQQLGLLRSLLTASSSHSMVYTLVSF